MKAYQLYPLTFSNKNLEKIFKEKISLSSAIGKDGVKIFYFEKNMDNEIDLIISKVEKQTYHFTGYKEKLISKGAGKVPRQISIPTVRDRLTLRAVCNLVTAVFGDCKTSNPHVIIKKIEIMSSRVGVNYCFLRMDVKDYYPTIDHDVLIRRIRKRIRKKQLISLIEKAIKTPTGKRNTSDNLCNIGVPQGLSISNILSAIYLAHLDEKYRPNMHYFRYVDDILIICKTTEAHKIFRKLQSDIRRTAKLECHPLNDQNLGKTSISKITEGVDYLGYNFTDKTVSVRPSSYKRMIVNLLKVFTQYKYLKDKERFLWRLNLKITGCVFKEKRLGWMFFFSQSENLSQLKRLDPAFPR